jgi:hypothetical protein
MTTNKCQNTIGRVALLIGFQWLSKLWKGRRNLPQQAPDDERNAPALPGNFAHSALGAAPPCWREAAAERWFRRAGVPGPANEHVFQYLLSKRTRGDTKGADLFYERQYRQYMNPTMGAYAATAALALLGCGGKHGAAFGRYRPLYAAA